MWKSRFSIKTFLEERYFSLIEALSVMQIAAGKHNLMIIHILVSCPLPSVFSNPSSPRPAEFGGVEMGEL